MCGLFLEWLRLPDHVVGKTLVPVWTGGTRGDVYCGIERVAPAFLARLLGALWRVLADRTSSCELQRYTFTCNSVRTPSLHRLREADCIIYDDRRSLILDGSYTIKLLLEWKAAVYHNETRPLLLRPVSAHHQCQSKHGKDNICCARRVHIR